MRSYDCKKRQCQVCKKEFPSHEVLPAEAVRLNIVEEIKKEHPDWVQEGFVCLQDLNHYRGHYIESLMEQEIGELTGVEREVISALKDQEVLSSNANVAFDRSRTLGERVADRMANFGGSWRFIGIFTAILMVWIVTNSHAILAHPFDPFPYILLNLVLSCLAAMQAPVIMMSQNRQEARDRLRAENDYGVNLKAELEIRLLSDRVDRLISQQWHRLLEIQQIQTDLIEELASRKK